MMKPALLAVAALSTVLAACSAPADDADEASVASEEAIISTDGASYSLRCKNGASSATVVLAAKDAAFDVTATSGSDVLFQASGQRPSINARIEDGGSDLVHEYIDWSDQGLETVPVDGPKAIELDLADGKKMTFKDAAQNVALSCQFDKAKLLSFLKVKLVSTGDVAGVHAVGFDIDDTLAFTTPTFARGFATGGTPGPTDTVFWTATNGCDQGCAAQTLTLPDGTTKALAANAASTAKSAARAVIAHHKAKGHKVYAITARPDINGNPLRQYIERELGIDQNDVFFEPDLDQPGNPKGKTDRIESLNLDMFYGDSDSDITDAGKAFVNSAGVRTKTVTAVRFLRSPQSSNRKAGKLNKYHPGYFGEAIVAGSYK